MSRRFRTLQANFAAGELDPKLVDRRDVERYYAGAERMRNVVAIPQGGFRRRWGSKFTTAVRHKISLLNLTAATVTAPNGGTVANATDGDRSTQFLTTTNIGVIDPYVVIHVDLGSAMNVDFATVYDMILTAGTGISDQFAIQYSTDDIAWTTMGASLGNLNSTTTVSQRRAGVTGTPISARYWRVARIGTDDLTTQRVQISGFELAAETAVYGTVRRRSFEDAAGNLFVLVFTDRNMCIVNKTTGVVVADVSIPHTDTQLAGFATVQSRDSILLWHEDVQPHQVQRQGDDTLWDEHPITFLELPTYNFRGDVITNPTLTVTATLGRGITVNASAAIFDSTMVGWSIRNVDQAGQGVIRQFNSSTQVLIDIFEEFTSSGAGAVTGWTLNEVAWSATRGWPRCAALFGGSLWAGGAKQLTNFIWRSVVGLLFDFNHYEPELDSNGIAGELAWDNVVDVFAFFPAFHLQVFTSRAEWFLLPDNAPITPTTADPRPTTFRGSKGPGLKVAGVDRGTLFVQRGGKAVVELTFTDQANPYEITNASLLSTAIISDPLSTAVRKSVAADDGDIYFVVNSDGTIAVLQTLRSQEILAWSKISTDGLYKDIDVTVDDIFAVVERTLNGTTVQWLEELRFDCFLDACVLVTTGLPATSVSGLPFPDGTTVKIYADQRVLDDAVVSSGTVSLKSSGDTYSATTSIEVGLAWPDLTGNGDILLVRTMPIEGQLPDGTQVGKKKRVVEVDLGLLATQDVWVGANAKAPRQFIFRKFGSGLLDEPPPTVTGVFKKGGLQGHTERGQVEITQREPGPLTVLSVTQKVSIQ